MLALEPQTEHWNNHGIEIWADERIWGHRFHDEQTPWLILLEFLAVFESRSRKNQALEEPRVNGNHESIPYHIPKLEELRFLIFNNPRLHHIEKTVDSDSEKWRQWKDSIRGSYNRDYSYLKKRFGDFSKFVRIVEFFQHTSLEPERNRRWTSKFVFPYGPDCIYADVREKGGSLESADRRFYARGGELLYLMLNRSSSAKELAELIRKKLLNSNERWNLLACDLIPEGENGDHIKTSVGYLPYERRQEYENIAEDWLQLLNLKIPGTSILDPLMRVTALNMLLYIMRRSLEEIGEGAEPCLVLEIAAPRKTALFELSTENYSQNRTLTRRALQAHIDSIKKTDAWLKACNERSPSQAVLQLFKKQFNWEPKNISGKNRRPGRILEELLKAAQKRHKAHVANVLPDWSRRIALSVSRRRMGTWYSPDDALLKALVMTIVEDREEYNRFLSKLYDRYRIVVGVAEAEKAFGSLPMDERVLAENAGRLEQRLRTLGLLHRLSDDCAYVINNFGGSQ